MAAPSLYFNGTTVTLPYPTPGSVREYDQRAVSRRTVEGLLRTSVLSYNYVYKLAFDFVSQTDYNNLVALWQDAATDGLYPTFTWDYWASANGIDVSVEIGPMAPSEGAVGYVKFGLILVEVNPR